MSTVDLKEEAFESTVNREGIVVIDWWASWCGPCRAFAPIYEKVAAKHPDIVFAKIDTEDQRGLAATFEIRSIPTLSILRDGVMVFHQPGMLPQAALEDLVKQARALDMKKVKGEAAA